MLGIVINNRYIFVDNDIDKIMPISRFILILALVLML